MSAEILVGIVMGSDSDWPCLEPAAKTLEVAKVDYRVNVVSAHRQPRLMLEYAQKARALGLEVIIAAAGGAAHLPGMLAAATTRPVLGVPVGLKYLSGLDSLLSIVQMPAGVPVGCLGIGAAENAALLAIRILALKNPALEQWLAEYQKNLEELVAKKDERLSKQLGGDRVEDWLRGQ